MPVELHSTLEMGTEPVDVVHVDADAAFAEEAATHLERIDDRISVRTVTDPDDVLALLDDDPVDCVVSAYLMDGTDGLGLLASVRERHPDLPFILYTGQGSEAVASDAIAAGVTDYFRKESGTAQYELLANRILDAVRQFRTQRRVQTQHSQYRRLFEDAPVMYVVFRDEDGEPVIEDCNSRFLDCLGYERDAVLGRSIREFYADSSVEQMLDGFDSGREGTFGQQERTLIDADGNRVETILRASPRMDEYGTVNGTIGLYVDLTERAQREQMLERLHGVTRDLLRADSHDEVAEIITEAVRNTLGYPHNLVRFVSDDGTELRPVAITDEAERMLGERPVYPVGEGTAGKAFASGETLIYDDVQAVDDGYERRDARSSMFVPIGNHGVLSIGDPDAGVFDDSDVHAAEIFAANADTALTLLDRTIELERQNERLAEFAGVVSHDLRTPLTVVDGCLTLARENCDLDELDRAARSLDRAFELSEDLLALARQGDTLDIESVDLRTVVESCWQNVETADATLAVDSTGTLRADESRLRQLLENLLMNCVEHGATDGAVTISAGALDDGFYVADDGPGIPAAEHDRVFEMGYTSDSGGTGMGLAIVQRIVEEHGGSVTVVESDEGTRFEVEGFGAGD